MRLACQSSPSRAALLWAIRQDNPDSHKKFAYNGAFSQRLGLYMAQELRFHRFSKLSPNAFDFRPRDLVVAGWTGRDRKALEHHVRELEALGVKRPSSMPVYYRIAAGNLTQNTHLQVLGADTSGEVEPVLFSMRDGLWLGIGSDHTDRKLETVSVAFSKQACHKIAGPHVWDCREIAAHWDKMILRSWIVESEDAQPVLYQEGSLSQMRAPADLIEGYAGANALPVGTVMFCGTFPAIGGIRAAQRFLGELEDPVLGRKLRFDYQIEPLPLVE